MLAYVFLVLREQTVSWILKNVLVIHVYTVPAKMKLANMFVNVTMVIMEHTAKLKSMNVRQSKFRL